MDARAKKILEENLRRKSKSYVRTISTGCGCLLMIGVAVCCAAAGGYYLAEQKYAPTNQITVESRDAQSRPNEDTQRVRISEE